MKLKYRNITVPYRVFDNKENAVDYIYKDKKYYDLLRNGEVVLQNLNVNLSYQY